MGSLTPGATYIYERVNDVVYKRETGSLERTVVSRDYDLHNQIVDAELWRNIHVAAKTNLALQEALDRVIIIYQLSKQHE